MSTVPKAIVSIVAAAVLSQASPAGAAIINIDATVYGYAFPTDPAPVPGQIIAPFSLAPGGLLNQLTLPAGTYQVTNATGLSGADPSFTGWRYDSGPDWTWSFVIANDANDAVVAYADCGATLTSQAAVAALPATQNVVDTFDLPVPTTLDFMIRDYFLPDNAGGVALNVQFVPEPGTLALFALSGLALIRRRRAWKPGCRGPAESAWGPWHLGAVAASAFVTCLSPAEGAAIIPAFT